MALHLRKAVIRNGAINTVVCLAVSLGLGLASGAIDLQSAQLAWPFALSAGIGLFSAWRTLGKIKAGVMQPVSNVISYLSLARDRDGALAGLADLDWSALDLYADQLATRGFSRAGDYTSYPLPRQFIGIAACFIDASQTTLVEVQSLQLRGTKIAAVNADAGGVHFSIASVVGGNIRVTTTDHRPIASNYLIRGDNDVVASYPGMGLFALLAKHEQLLAALQERTGKRASTGFTMARYVLLQRESMRQARNRLARLGGYAIATQIDAFEAEPLRKWAPPTARLAALPERRLDELDGSDLAGSQPPLMGGQGDARPEPAADRGDRTDNDNDDGNGGGSRAAAPRAATVATAATEAQLELLRERAVSGANWFYWIAGLSLVNAAIEALGSDWSFAIGLGLSQLLAGIGDTMDAAGTSIGAIGPWYAASIGVTAFFAACGWFSRRASVIAFIAGIAVFALDSLIFVLAADWIGVGFHVLALFYIWGGFSAARRLRRQAIA